MLDLKVVVEFYGNRLFFILLFFVFKSVAGAFLWFEFLVFILKKRRGMVYSIPPEFD